MKKRVGIFVVLTWIAASATSCGIKGTIVEYNFFSYYVWINDSDRQITLSVEAIREYDAKGEASGFENKVLAPGGRFEVTQVWNSMVSPYAYAKKITVVFDDGVQAVYDDRRISETPYPAGYDPSCNLRFDVNYEFEQVNDHLPASGGRWTYTFTDADYEAAKAMMEAIE